ncbi:ACP S-malonyltransferase [Rubrimonas cliftonensis]|uniref:Malonyl CoA-acyl carrier protein transacylase n=1 Tax=Rubrimonas cliftonensis TaxID=89524 RepID=A0A1H3ZID7_9RHOB|nr:ACP S-malonyltransferase [Rubrimonas cliftonensis]SEA23460.1 [acyl-carrier-protein] S-malonyltransferase [Rubrimonas cliftonensis]
MSRAFVFPGQGSQSVGMGRALAEACPAARAVFDEVDDALGERLSAVMWDGPEEALALTANAQPALMATSMAALRALEAEGVVVSRDAAFVAGHSLGEYSALCAAGALSIADAARLLRLRGAAMQAATPVGVGAMAALLGLELAAAQAVAADAAQGAVCEAANDNAPGQVVVSGHREAVERAVALAGERGARRAIMLSVSAPFHCALMSPAADAMREALGRAEVLAPKPALVSNVSAEAVDDPDRIRALLVEQVTGMVRWRESVAWMAGRGVTELVEIGAGKVLSGLARRIERSLGATSVSSPEDVAAAAAAMSA